jgi:hypothetical protein
MFVDHGKLEMPVSGILNARDATVTRRVSYVSDRENQRASAVTRWGDL